MILSFGRYWRPNNDNIYGIFYNKSLPLPSYAVIWHPFNKVYKKSSLYQHSKNSWDTFIFH